MYKQHIIACYVVGVSVFLCSYCFNFSYACIASDALTLVSIVLAVYIAVPSALLGSTYSRILKKSKDNKIPTQSLLGTLKKYLWKACSFGVTTLIISSYYIVRPHPFAPIMLNNKYIESIDLERFFSSASLCVFSINIFFLWLITRLLLVFLFNAASNLDEKQ